MISRSLAVLAALAVSSPAFAQVEASLAEARETPVLTLQVSEEVTREPDIVRFQVGISEEKSTAREALNAATQRLSELVATLEAAGIEKDDLTTSNISLGQRYDYGGRRPVFVGYTGSASMSFETTLDADIPALLDRLGEANVSSVNGPSFDLEDRLSLRAVARKRALERADAEAAEYAQLRGFARARLVSIEEGQSFHSGEAIIVTGSRVMNGAPPPPPPPVPERGGGALLGAEIGEQVTVRVLYTLER
ncbi:SIMPL domain-containing protein [Sphingomicrobium nitratireducens]|uniref:SIMPL domain-containing protein n=1 Tax=Sphingomicrobium nitratireducens TaxID=2964666 RepID=UPI00223EF456|nr:SIMPL domain-containing protein [Sphingomicrobium nitratireducens]